ncbi:MAG: o-succinylbenzoate synthase [Bacteroidota bacterium]
MKIVDVQCFPYNLSLNPPLQGSKVYIRSKQGFIVKLTDTAGNVAFGDVSPLRLFGSESYALSMKAYHNLAKKIILMQRLSLKNLDDNLSPLNPFPALRCGIEQALLELIAKAKNTTLYSLLELDEPARNVRTNALIGILPVEETLAKAREYLEKGFDTIKIKAGRDDFEEDLRVLKELRKLAGPQVNIRIDVNGKWTLAQAKEHILELAELNPEYIEQPVASKEDLIELSRVSPVQVAADESIRNINDANELLKYNIVFILKPMIIGGILRTLEIIRKARKKNRKIVISSSIETSVGKDVLDFLASVIEDDTAHGLNSPGFLEDPDLPALISENQIIRRSGFIRLVGQYIAALIQHGISGGDRVAVISENNIYYPVLLYSLWKLKTIPVPLNVRLTQNELTGIIEHAGCRHIMMSRSFANSFNFENAISFPFDQNLPPVSGQDGIIPAFTNNTEDKAGSVTGKTDYHTNEFEKAVHEDLFSLLDQTALIIFTSGSSGKPKGVVLTFRNLLESVYLTDQIVNHNAGDKWLASLPFYHIGGIMILLRSYVLGCSVIIPENLHVQGIKKAMTELKPSFASLVGTSLKQLLETGTKPPEELRAVFLGGGPADDNLVREALDAGFRIVKVYGSTETCSMITAVDLARHPDKISSSGHPLSSGSVVIKGNNNNRVPPGVPGEIVVSGTVIFREYLDDPGSTSDKIKKGRYQTGDIGYTDDDGYLYVLSRRTDLIVSGGENITPVEVETVLNRHPKITESCVFGYSDEKWGEIAAAAVVPEPETDITEGEIITYLKEHIAGFKVPKKYFFAAYLPHTSIGKIMRDEIKKMFLPDDVCDSQETDSQESDSQETDSKDA